MYIVDRIEENIVILESTKDNKMIEIEINNFENKINEGDIIDIINNKYIINEKNTKKRKNNIRDRFNKLKNK